MRRALLAVTLGGVLLTAGACGSDSDDTTAGPRLVMPSSAAPPTAAAPDYSANTAQVCGKVNTIFSKDFAGFSTELGKMIANKEAKQADEAEKFEKAAAAQLKSVGAKLRKETAAAEDPELKEAGATSAAKLTASAGDAKFFDGIKTEKDLGAKIEDKMLDWMNPVRGLCA